MPLPNSAKDVFRHVDMSGGAEACWPFTGALNNKGRPYFRVDGKAVLAYRLVYELVKGTEPGKDMIRHTCDNPACCNPAHHLLGNNQQNMDDMKQRDRHGVPRHVVRAIRKLGDAGMLTHEQIAELYGLGRSTVTEIINRSVRTHIGEDEDGETG